MAIYKYLCPQCSKEFEVMRSMSGAAKPTPCTICEENGEKLMSNFDSKAGFCVKVPEKPPFRKRQQKPKK